MKLGIIYINAKQNVGDLNEAIESTRHMAFGTVLNSFGALTANAQITPITKGDVGVLRRQKLSYLYGCKTLSSLKGYKKTILKLVLKKLRQANGEMPGQG